MARHDKIDVKWNSVTRFYNADSIIHDCKLKTLVSERACSVLRESMRYFNVVIDLPGRSEWGIEIK